MNGLMDVYCSKCVFVIGIFAETFNREKGFPFDKWGIRIWMHGGGENRLEEERTEKEKKEAFLLYLYSRVKKGCRPEVQPFPFICEKG
ncbi:MAG: hypothetical protein HXY45_02435 [Syntrophaceae bacterium]|nr:hypothetical protein [Syntrophaceae bacterium]